MAALERTETGGFSIGESVTISELDEMSEEDRVQRLIPTESLFYTLEKVELPAFYEKLCRGGCEIYQKKLRSDFAVGQRVRLYGAGGFFAEMVLQPLGANTKGSQFLEPDGNFPNHAPNPENADAMDCVSKATIDADADFGVMYLLPLIAKKLDELNSSIVVFVAGSR